MTAIGGAAVDDYIAARPADQCAALSELRARLK